MTSFFQEGPELKNPFTSDQLLQSLLRRFLTPEQFHEVAKDLTRFGSRILNEIEPLGLEAEHNPPRHIPFDPWGNRIDQIETSPAWDRLAAISAEEGLVGLGYERPYGENSRLVQFAKLMLFHPSSAYFTCPLAMTDGAARLIELHGDQELKNRAYQHLISRDPKKAWTSGQWMTEKTGGSDVGRSETVARFEDGHWRLYGVKWFTSAITSQMTMALARVEEDGQTLAGSRGLGLFYLELRREDGQLNNLEVLRLKDKLGTKALPTAELKLNGSVAKMVAPAQEGVKTIASLFNVTRIYNACTSLGAFRRLLNLSHDYALKREAFKQKIAHHPLHQHTLAELEIDYASVFHLCFYVARLQGLEEKQPQKTTGALLRLFTPITKLVSAKVNMAATSELIESFGGAGYIEDTGLPRYLRDAQVLSIWEGTTNVLSLDTLRAIEHDQALIPWFKNFQERLKTLREPGLLQSHFDQLQKTIELFSREDGLVQQRHARELAFSLANLQSLLLMTEHAEWSKNPRDKVLAERFGSRPQLLPLKLMPKRAEQNKLLVSLGE